MVKTSPVIFPITICCNDNCEWRWLLYVKLPSSPMGLVRRQSVINALPKNSCFLLSTFIFTVTLSPSYSLIQIDITVTYEWRWLLYVKLPSSPMRLVHRQSVINALPKNSPLDCFLNGRFQVPSSLACIKIEKTWYARYQVFSMVRVTGLEPVRRGTHGP